MNELALHVCCVGNFDTVEPGDGMLAVLVKRVITPWRRQFGIPVERIVTHSAYNPLKSCPGRMFDMAKLRGLAT